MLKMKIYNKSSKKDIMSMVTILESVYKDAKCGLDYNSPFSLVISLILAAQCTDARVNVICPILLSKYPNALNLSNANIDDIQKIIYPCGFYKNKAKNIKKCANQILSDFNGKVPSNMNDLLSLAGVGRKSANVILLEAFGIANRNCC